MTHKQHLDEIMRAPMSQRERLRQIDERSLDILYDDMLRRVAYAVAEPEPMRLPPAHVWLVGALLWLPLVVLGIEFFRP